MTKRKVSAERNERLTRLRFAPDDIVRAIAGVEAAGLEVYAVEITTAGSILISTGRSSGAIAPLTTTDGSVTSDNTQPKKKQG